jgi:acyl-CoA reductase-like NAD-dependent aldehyde dehydrogenase
MAFARWRGQRVTASVPELRDSYDLMIAGDWVAGEDGAQDVTIDPASDSPVAKVTRATAGDVDRAVSAAREAAVGWSALPWVARAAKVRELADQLEADVEGWARLDVVDAGIPIRGMRRDVANAVSYLRYYAGLASELKGHAIDAAPSSVDFTVREPFGVVGRIIPFNHPLQFAAAAVAAPLVAGNAVVLKPAQQSPLSALHFGELAAAVLPPGVVNVVTGDAEAGSALVRHPDVPRIGFTGSVATGRSVLRDAAEDIKVVTLELGGKNPLIVLPDADPQLAAELANVGMNLQRTAGQSCGSTSRVYLHEDVHDDVLSLLVDRFAALVVGDPADEHTDVGPLAFAAHRDRVRAAIATAVDEGAQVRVGGAEPPDDLPRGCYVRPTVLAGVHEEMRVASEEIFGPVVAVLRWRDEDQLVARANALPLGLTANIATNDLTAALRLAHRIEAGYVWVNGRGQRPFGAPFGGWKHSGLGEENTLAELLSYTRTKNINLSALQ